MAQAFFAAALPVLEPQWLFLSFDGLVCVFEELFKVQNGILPVPVLTLHSS